MSDLVERIAVMFRNCMVNAEAYEGDDMREISMQIGSENAAKDAIAAVLDDLLAKADRETSYEYAWDFLDRTKRELGLSTPQKELTDE